MSGWEHFNNFTFSYERKLGSGGVQWVRAGGPGVLGVSVALGGLGGRGLVVLESWGSRWPLGVSVAEGWWSQTGVSWAPLLKGE